MCWRPCGIGQLDNLATVVCWRPCGISQLDNLVNSCVLETLRDRPARQLCVCMHTYKLCYTTLDRQDGDYSSTYIMPLFTGAAASCDWVVEADAACVLAMLRDDVVVNFALVLLLRSSAANCTHKPSTLDTRSPQYMVTSHAALGLFNLSSSHVVQTRHTACAHCAQLATLSQRQEVEHQLHNTSKNL